MSPKKETTQKIESQPAGEPLPAQPAVETPTGKSLAELFEGGPSIAEISKEPPAEESHGTFVLTTDPPHRCSICNGPDHRACGCEAKALRKSQEQKPDQAGSRMDQELKSDEVHVDDVLEKLFKDTLNPVASDMAISVVAAVEKFQDFQQSVLDGLTDIRTVIEELVLLEKSRLERLAGRLLKDINDAEPT